MKDFLQFGAQLTALTSFDLSGIEEKGSMIEIMKFLPTNINLERLSIRSTYLKVPPSLTELLNQTNFTKRAKYTQIDVLKVRRDNFNQNADVDISNFEVISEG